MSGLCRQIVFCTLCRLLYSPLTLALRIVMARKAPFWTPIITACWLSVALCTVCMPMLFARCLLSGVWQLVRSLTPNMVFTQVVTLCNPCSFFGTYNMLHEQSQWILHSLICKPMTPFQGMHYALWKHLRRTRMPAPLLSVIQDMYTVMSMS